MLMISFFQGVLAAVPLAYILPAAAYIKVTGGNFFSWRKAPAIILAVVGVIVAVTGTIKAIFDIVNGVSCSHDDIMPYCRVNNTVVLNSTTSPAINTTYLY